MKSLRVLTVLGLVLVLVYSQVQGLPTQGSQETKGCGTVLGPEDLHKVSGAWVLVFITYDLVKSERRGIRWMGWSHLEVQVQPDNHTFSIQEDNMLLGRCGSSTYNLTLSESGAGVQQMHMHKTEMTLDDQMVQIDERATLYILSFSEKTFNLLYKSKNSNEELLLTFQREGLHEGDLQKQLVEHRVKAECLGLSGDTVRDWQYISGCDGFCLKQPTLGPEQLHQMIGDWVLVFLTYDQIMSRARNIPLMTSSHVTVQEISADNRTAIVHENNMVGGKCVSVPFNVTRSGTAVNQLHMLQTDMFVDEELVRIHDEAKLQVHLSPNTMSLLLKGSHQELLLALYRRRGHHEEDLMSNLVVHRVKARCLSLIGRNIGEWHYDGRADFCHRSPAPATVLS